LATSLFVQKPAFSPPPLGTTARQARFCGFSLKNAIFGLIIVKIALMFHVYEDIFGVHVVIFAVLEVISSVYGLIFTVYALIFCVYEGIFCVYESIAGVSEPILEVLCLSAGGSGLNVRFRLTMSVFD
jgi:hypothetical protein